MASTEVSAEWTASVRKKTFTRWINAYCRRHSLTEPSFEVKDLFNDLRDGTTLCLLMSTYIGVDLILHSSDDGPLEHNQKIENVEQVIQEVNCNGVRRFTGSSDLIVDGDQEATLELVWWVIFIIQLSFEGSSEIDLWDEAKVREEMLKWVQRRLARHPRRVLEVTNFSTSWSDGKAFCAVMYDYNAKTFSYSELEGKEPKSWLEYAFWFAHEKVSVDRLLDTEDVAVPFPDEKCILIYLSLLRQKLVFMPDELSMGKKIVEIWEQVSTMNADELPKLKAKFASWGPPAENKVILNQLDQLQKLKMTFDQFAKDLAMLSAKEELKYQQKLEEEFVELEAEFKRGKKVLDDVMAAAEDCRAPVEQFDLLISAEDSVVSWLNEAKGDVQGLLDIACDEARYDEARQSLLSIQQAAVERWPAVDTLQRLAEDFTEQRKKVIDILVHYRKEPVPTFINEEGSSLKEQASKVLQDWVWIVNQCISVLQEWFMIVLTWKMDEDFSSRKEERKAFLHSCNSVFEVLIHILETCSGESGLNRHTLREKKEAANNHWAEEELRELNQWVKSCLDGLFSQRPLSDTLDGVKKQRQWYQKFLQHVSEREPEVLIYETFHLTGLYQPTVMREAREIKEEHRLLGEQWMKLQQQKLIWSDLLDSCEAAWESCHATEGELRSLEEVRAQWESPEVKYNSVAQLKEMETFRTSRVVPFKSEVSAMADKVAHLKSLGGHPPVEELCRCVTERYDRLVVSLTKLYAAIQTQVDLTGRWKALVANAQALIDWAEQMREKLSEAIADKANFGVEDHLAICEELNQSSTRKKVDFVQFQGDAASFEAEARGKGWDSEEVSTKSAQVQQSWVSLLDFIGKTKAQLQDVATKLKDLLHVLTDKQAWLAEFTGRLMKWQPCLGDVSIVKFQLDKAEGLLAEALTHDEATMQLANDMEFVVECSRQSERKPAKDAIMIICQCHTELKQQLQGKVSQCQAALPLWQSFTATTTELAKWMEEKEKLLSLPSIRVGEEDELVEQIKSVQRDLVHGKDKLELLASLETDLTEVCDMEEDKAYVAKKCTELRSQYNQLEKIARDALEEILNKRTTSRSCHYFDRRLCLLLLGVGLGVGLWLTPKFLNSRLGTPTLMPSVLLAMDATYIWLVKQDIEIGL